MLDSPYQAEMLLLDAAVILAHREPFEASIASK